MLAAKILTFEEGFRERPYYCSEGYPTIGIGRVIGTKGDPLPDITTTLEFELEKLHRKITALEISLADIMDGHNEIRRAILISMAYQMGVNGLRQFRFFLQALKEQNYELAADHMLDSKWARQTPSRAKRHAAAVRGDRVPEYE